MATPRDRAIKTVQYCLRSYLKNIARCKGYNLKQESYSYWAAEEILLKLISNPDIPPLIVIEQFRDQMSEYSGKNRYTSCIFSVAKDTAEWIIDLLIC
jgi:hypothetical protein